MNNIEILKLEIMNNVKDMECITALLSKAVQVLDYHNITNTPSGISKEFFDEMIEEQINHRNRLFQETMTVALTFDCKE